MLRSMHYLALLPVIGLILFTGCKEEEEVSPSESEMIYVFGNVGMSSHGNSYTYVIIGDDPLPDVQSVLVNDDTLVEGSGLGYKGYYSNAIDIYPDSTYALAVNHTGGTATASIKFPVPGDFGLTQPSGDYYTIPEDSDLVVIWMGADKGDWYNPQLHIWCDYKVNGEWKEFDLDTSVITTDTTVTLSKDLFLPAEYDTIEYWSGWLWMYLVNGPQSISGANGNVSGAGCGFWYANYEDRGVHLSLEGISYKSHQFTEKPWVQRAYEYLNK